MSTINGLPVHILLVHFVVVLAPLTALLAILSTIWPAARRRLVWPVLGMAAFCVVLTPLTTEAGEWLERRVAGSVDLYTHIRLGDTMIYFSLALAVAAMLLAVIHVRAEKGMTLNPIVAAVMSMIIIAAGIGTIVQVYRIGDSGSRSVWGNALSGD